MRLIRVTPPTGDVVSLADAKTHLKVDWSDEDDYIAGLVAAATQHFDAIGTWSGRALRPQVWDYVRDSFYAETHDPRHHGDPTHHHLQLYRHGSDPSIKLPIAPLISVQSVTYADAANVQQTLDPSAYDVLGLGDVYERGAIRPVFRTFWPIASWRQEAVKIRFTCGYPDTTDDPPLPTVPDPIRISILWLVGHWFKTREAVGQAQNVELPFTVNAMFSPYRVRA